MYNITVTSEFDEDSQDQTRERIEESAVFLNFFNPPTHLWEDQMDLIWDDKKFFQCKLDFYRRIGQVTLHNFSFIFYSMDPVRPNLSQHNIFNRIKKLYIK